MGKNQTIDQWGPVMWKGNLELQLFLYNIVRTCPMIDRLYDWLLLNIQQRIFYAFSGREQVQQFLIIIQKWGRDRAIGTKTFYCHWKNMES